MSKSLRFSSPQDERDFIWQESNELKRSSISNTRDELIINRNNENQIYESELSKLRTENVSLRDQLQRTLRELKVYQVKYPSAYVTLDAADENLPPWAISPELSTPLFSAYDSS